MESQPHEEDILHSSTSEDLSHLAHNSLKLSRPPRDRYPLSPTHSRSSSLRRSSLGSVKEDETEVAQSFVDTKIPSSETPAISDKTAIQVHPQQCEEFCCPCGAFRGWKQIPLGGRRQSRSYSDLRLLGSAQSKGWAWETANFHPILPVKEEAKKPDRPPSGRAPLELLPPEILDQIVSNLSIDIPPNGYTPRNVDLISCLLTSRTLHSATLGVLYRNITIPHSVIFSKLLRHIRQYHALGTIVRRLDFSHFTSVGLGRTQQMNMEIQNLTSKTLLECLDLLPNLKECLLQEHVENDVNGLVVLKLFTSFPSLRALDFCGCSSHNFSDGFLAAVKDEAYWPSILPNLTRLSLHECSGLPIAAFEGILPRLVNLTHLDVAHTQITNDALFLIPESARLTHLNLSRCTRLTGPDVVKFLTTHAAVMHTLVYLNLMVDVSRHRLLDENDVETLLPCLKPCLRSLNVGGGKVSSAHMPMLITLSKHLEELGLDSANLTVADLNSFFVEPSPPAPNTDGLDAADTISTNTGATTTSEWIPPTLRYLDLTKNPYLTQAVLFNTKNCLLVTPQSSPLDVIELSEKIIIPLRQRSQAKGKGNGWVVRDLGRRGWYVRESSSSQVDADLPRVADDGRRPWKMGARWWGMRKIPVALGDVGGLYGHYMYKR